MLETQVWGDLLASNFFLIEEKEDKEFWTCHPTT
jgi:hypothetical protein